jgi:hypothetical protein
MAISTLFMAYIGKSCLQSGKFTPLKLTVTDLFQSVEDRDGMFKSGMKEGATESMDRLEEIVLKALKMQ